MIPLWQTFTWENYGSAHCGRKKQRKDKKTNIKLSSSKLLQWAREEECSSEKNLNMKSMQMETLIKCAELFVWRKQRGQWVASIRHQDWVKNWNVETQLPCKIQCKIQSDHFKIRMRRWRSILTNAMNRFPSGLLLNHIRNDPPIFTCTEYHIKLKW